MPKAEGLKALAMKVLSEGTDTSPNQEHCPKPPVSKKPNGTGQCVGQTVGQGLKVPARVRGKGIAGSTHAETCFHCNGSKRCKCALCAMPLRALATKFSFQRGPCRACLGTGLLAWPEKAI